MRDFFKYPRRAFEAHTAAMALCLKAWEENIFSSSGLFLLVLLDPRLTVWVYLLVGYGVPMEKIVILTPDAELGAELFTGRGSFPGLRVIIGDPLESLMEFRQKARFVLFGSTLDGFVPDLAKIRRFSEITLMDNGMLFLDYPSTFMYVTPAFKDDVPDVTVDPYERFTQIAREYDIAKPDGPDNAYNTLMTASGQDHLGLLYDHLDQGLPRVGFVATTVLMSLDVRPDGLFVPIALTVLNVRRISMSKSVKALRQDRDRIRREDSPVRVTRMRPDDLPVQQEPATPEDLWILRMQIGLHPDERGMDHMIPPRDRRKDT